MGGEREPLMVSGAGSGVSRCQNVQKKGSENVRLGQEWILKNQQNPSDLHQILDQLNSKPLVAIADKGQIP